MSKRYKGGIISATGAVSPGGARNPGVWTLDQHLEEIFNNTWPGSHFL